MYSVKISKPGSIFSKKFDNVVGDALIQNKGELPMNARCLILSDGRRIDVSFNYIMEFSKERELEIKKDITDTASGKKKK